MGLPDNRIGPESAVDKSPGTPSFRCYCSRLLFCPSAFLLPAAVDAAPPAAIVAFDAGARRSRLHHHDHHRQNNDISIACQSTSSCFGTITAQIFYNNTHPVSRPGAFYTSLSILFCSTFFLYFFIFHTSFQALLASLFCSAPFFNLLFPIATAILTLTSTSKCAATIVQLIGQLWATLPAATWRSLKSTIIKQAKPLSWILVFPLEFPIFSFTDSSKLNK